MRLTAASYVTQTVPSGKTPGNMQIMTRFPEYMPACRAPIRTCTVLYGSATSAWVRVSPQSELVGASSADFALTAGILLRIASALRSTCSCPSTP